MVVDIGKIEQHAIEASFKYNNEWINVTLCMRHYVDIYVTSKLEALLP